MHRKKGTSNNFFEQPEKQNDEAQFFRLLEEEDNFFYSFSYSMSYSSSSVSSDSIDQINSSSTILDNSVFTGSTLSPTIAPTNTPTFARKSALIVPIINPTQESFSTPEQNQDLSDTPSESPSSQPQSRSFSFVRKCENDDTQQTLEQQQSVNLSFQYKVELSSDSDDDFLSAIESSLLDTVASAVLNCSNRSPSNRKDRRRVLLRPNLHMHRHLEVSQVDSRPADFVVGFCKPILSETNICRIVESNMSITTTNYQDSEKVKQEALTAINTAMTSGEIVGTAPDKINPLRVEYIPDLDPVTSDQSNLVVSETEGDESTVFTNLNGATDSSISKSTKSNTLLGFVGMVPLALLIGMVFRRQQNSVIEKFQEDYCDDDTENEERMTTSAFFDAVETAENENHSVNLC
eukprot:CAMPEP_0178939732 /NCGR_PEP_ID=MMETSP0789-20121207/384_1 /TAXON_ID=3005 /ORGANISM="Rhizosolenia setigera, Strain CCMP 1694" /LENGTH=405 /DNA_ID=CAMNT_0020618627 /DNA_START=237 /DNA_END=1454 /DNA_ORIENTATION=-